MNVNNQFQLNLFQKSFHFMIASICIFRFCKNKFNYKNISFILIQMTQDFISYNPELNQTVFKDKDKYQLLKQKYGYSSYKKQPSITSKHTFQTKNYKSSAKFTRTNPNLHQQIVTSPQKTNQEQSQGSFYYYKHGEYHLPCTKPQLSLISALNTSKLSAGMSTDRQLSLESSSSKQYRTQLKGRYLPKAARHQEPPNYDSKLIRSDLSMTKASKLGQDTKIANQNYSFYWKRKAHQYLDNNFKLISEIESLKRRLEECELLCKSGQRMNDSQECPCNGQNKNTQQGDIPLHVVKLQQRKYKEDISHLQTTTKVKDLLILRLQNKVLELNQQIKGQNQQSQLLQKLRSQLEQLQKGNIRLNAENQRITQINKVCHAQKGLKYQVFQKQTQGHSQQFGISRFRKNKPDQRLRTQQ